MSGKRGRGRERCLVREGEVSGKRGRGVWYEREREGEGCALR